MFFQEIANLADNSFGSKTITNNQNESRTGEDNDSNDEIDSDSIRGSVQSDKIESERDINGE